MERNIQFAPGEYYHIYSRGTNRADIYIDNADRDRFINLLYVCNSDPSVHLSNLRYQGQPLVKSGIDTIVSQVDRPKTLVDIGAYCLMSNHYHLLVHEKESGGISKYMLKLNTGYSMYFNKRHERSGSLFESRFKAKHVSDDSYLKYLFAYIHLNPLSQIDSEWKSGEVDHLEVYKSYIQNFKYSSYQDYSGIERAERAILERAPFPYYFASNRDFTDYVHDWINMRSVDHTP
jgi:putative transposase